MSAHQDGPAVRWGRQAALIALSLVFLFPAYILVNLAIKDPSESSDPLALVTNPTLQNFVDAWQDARLGSALVNSLVVTAGSTVLAVLLAALAAYPLARSTQRWSRVTFVGFMAGLLIPFQLIMIPLYATFRDLQILGTVPGLVLLYTGTQLPFAVFMYTTFLRALDRDYEEAAELDGCNSLRTFWHVVFPLMRPITGTVAILNVITVWNDFFAALLFLKSDNATVPLALYGFVGAYFAEWNLVFAGLILSAIPVLALYLALQRTVIQGFAGGLKG